MAWVRYDDAFHRHPKVMAVKAEDPAALAMHVLCATASAETSTPGVVGWPILLSEASGAKTRAKRWAELLTRHGLWHAAGHDCESCEQPPDGAWVIHDWSQYNGAVGLSKKRSIAGKKGSDARWGKGKGHADANGKPMATDGSRTPAPTDVAAAPEPLPPPLAELQRRLEAVHLVVRWDKLSADQIAEIEALVDKHSITRLVTVAQKVWQRDNPPAFAQAWIPAWQQLPSAIQAVREKCSEHGTELPCSGCAADRKAAS